MKNTSMQYPEAYSHDHSRYIFFCDDGTQVTLVSGQDGVTEEWIATLKDEHRQETNLMRRGRSKGGEGNKVISLTQFEDETNDAGALLIDPNSDVEGQFFADFEAGERRKQLHDALIILTDTQRELLIAVRIRHVPITEIAMRDGVGKSAICNRMKKIDKKLKKFLEGG